MIVFSDKQLAVLTDISRRRSYINVAESLSVLEPRIFAALSDDERLLFVEFCHLSARKFGFNTMSGLYCLADVSILIGAYFWRDPFFRDITDELNQRSVRGDDMVMRRIGAGLSNILLEMRGKNCEIMSRSLREFISLHVSGYLVSTYSPASSAIVKAMSLVSQVCPVVLEIFGADLVSARTEVVIAHAQSRYFIRDSSALATFNIISIILGIGFDVDPLYPWISADLARSGDIGGEVALSRVVSRLVFWFEAAIEEINAYGVD